MTANVETEPGATDDTKPGPSALKKLYLAMLGSGIVIQEESAKLFEYLVERGTPIEEPVRQHVANVREKIDRAVDRVVRRHTDPKEAEIADLSKAVDRLQERLERL